MRNIREISCGVYARNLFAVLRERREEYAHVLRNAKIRGTAKCARNRHEVYAKREFTRNVVRAHNAHGLFALQLAIVVAGRYSQLVTRYFTTGTRVDTASWQHDTLPQAHVLTQPCQLAT